MTSTIKHALRNVNVIVVFLSVLHIRALSIDKVFYLTFPWKIDG